MYMARGISQRRHSYAFGCAVRAFTAIPMHASCGVVMGYYGESADKSIFSGSRRHLVMRLVIPIFFHANATYNFLFSSATDHAGRLCLRLHKVFIQEQKLKAAETERKFLSGFSERSSKFQ